MFQVADQYFTPQSIVIGHLNHLPVTHVYPQLIDIIREDPVAAPRLVGNTPDPQRLGGLAWARSTGGRLTRRAAPPRFRNCVGPVGKRRRKGHSYRTWLFGRALATLDGNTMDDELFYCGALLHDYGIVSPTADRDFTLGSVDRMLACTSAAGDERADLLGDAIQNGAHCHDARGGGGGAEGTLRTPRSLRTPAGRAAGAIRLLTPVNSIAAHTYKV